MRDKKTLKKSGGYFLLFAVGIFALWLLVTMAFAHGGKHAGQFTRLEALQKGTGLFDQLIAEGKLDESWEAGLAGVSISKRSTPSGEEVAVAFRREAGEPDTVYIFFTSDGTYAGSNFTGK